MARVELDDAIPYQKDVLQEIQANGTWYEGDLLWLLGKVLKPGDVFVDAGANVGRIALLAASFVGATGRGLAFDAEEENCQHLEENLAKYGVQNVQCFHAALGSSERDATLFINDDNAGGHALWDVGILSQNVKSREMKRTKTIRLQMLDHFIEQAGIDRLHLIKTDVEGADHDVLKGAEKSILKYGVKFIVSEMHHAGLVQMGSNGQKFRAYMKDLGYECYGLTPHAAGLIRLDPTLTYELPFVFNMLFSKDSYLTQYGIFVP